MVDSTNTSNAYRIVLQNDHVVVAYKPCGMLSVPSRQGVQDSRPVLGILLQHQLQRQIFPVHRLDVDVSGLILYALHAQAHRVANHWFETQRVQKTYRAWTTSQSFEHIPEHIDNSRAVITLHSGMRFEWHGKLLRGKRRTYTSPKGKPTHTLATYLGQEDAQGFLQWDLQPRTGRSHQLRVDLSRHGFPIVGDELYGSPVHSAAGCIALLAYALDFQGIEPAQRLDLPEEIQISADMPFINITDG